MRRQPALLTLTLLFGLAMQAPAQEAASGTVIQAPATIQTPPTIQAPAPETADETAAQAPVPDADSVPATDNQADIEQLRAELQKQRDQLDHQDEELQAQRKTIAGQVENIKTQRKELDTLEQMIDQVAAGEPVRRPADAQATIPEAQVDTGAPVQLPKKPKASPEAETSQQDESDPQAEPEALKPEDVAREELRELPETPADVLQAGEFAGSVHLPGTNLNAKVGGFVRLGLVDNIDPIGSDDRFIVGSIPTGESTAEQQPRINISAQRSRMNLDMRMDSDVGQFRAFLEGDFAGDGDTDNYRLRHAYGQYNRLLLGQTWSTLMDTHAIPEELDFEGLSAQINVRQPLARWGDLQFIGRTWAGALENPQPSLSGGDGVGRWPDMVAHTKWTTPTGHFQLGALLRSLRGKPTLEDDSLGEEDSARGYGLSMSGLRIIDEKNGLNNIRFQVSGGWGIGNYINDLGSVGGQDGVFDPETGNLEALPVVAGYVSYQHFWRPKATNRLFQSARSTYVYSYVWVDNYDFQPGDAYNATQRMSLNLVTSPIPALDLGFEFLWGARRDKDGAMGRAKQLQMVATFRF